MKKYGTSNFSVMLKSHMKQDMSVLGTIFH